MAAGLADLAVRVIDPTGRPIAGATVRVPEQAVSDSTGEGGVVVARGLPPGNWTVDVEVEHFRSSGSLPVAVEAGASEQVVVLDWVPTTLRLRTQLADGTPVSARVQPEGGPADVAPVRTGSDGTAVIEVVPGDWRLLATAEARVAELRQTVAPGQPTAEVVLTLESSSARLEGRTVEITERVLFDFNAATLRPDAEPVLDAVARVIRAEPGIVRIEVQGHTDNIGDVAVNQALSQLRAESVVAALVERGVAPEKLAPAGYGRSRPRASNDTLEGRRENRRVQFEVLESID